jgi:hypothetical protein
MGRIAGKEKMSSQDDIERNVLPIPDAVRIAMARQQFRRRAAATVSTARRRPKLFADNML